jgi:uncharacterized protein YdeI (YjbR/CyaY-like superfamily)
MEDLDGHSRLWVGNNVRSMTPRFFKTPGDWRRWLTANHESERELWVGFHKLATGKPSVTYHEALDEALAFGWIDGVRKSIDPSSYVIRFTPRKANSIWSAVNLKRVKALIDEGRMSPHGLAVYQSRNKARTNRYSFEQKAVALTTGHQRTFKANPEAWAFFNAQPPGYRRVATWFVVSAKKEETKERRLATLIRDSAAGRRLGILEKRSKG